MKAAVFQAPHDVQIAEWATPEPVAGEVVVAVRATGICAGDLYLYQGKNPYGRYPQIGGHEIAGVVAAVGAGVRGIEPGERVVVEPFVGCGHCYPCRIGKPNCCTSLEIIGVHRPGGFAQYVSAPARLIHRIPSGVSDQLASFAEPVAIALQATRRVQLATGELAVVLGLGPIGQALIEVARAKGARVIGVDRAPARLELASSLGAEAVIDTTHEDLGGRVLELTGGEGAPVVFEATGNAQVMEQSIELVAAGGRLGIIGLLKQGEGVTWPGLDFTRKELTIAGSRASTECFPEALELLASGRITYPQAAQHFSMWEAPAVFARLDAAPQALTKAVLCVE